MQRLWQIKSLCYLENLKVEEGGETYTHTLNYLLLSLMS